MRNGQVVPYFNVGVWVKKITNLEKLSMLNINCEIQGIRTTDFRWDGCREKL